MTDQVREDWEWRYLATGLGRCSGDVSGRQVMGKLGMIERGKSREGREVIRAVGTSTILPKATISECRHRAPRCSLKHAIPDFKA
jgi:hypothetical protein